MKTACTIIVLTMIVTPLFAAPITHDQAQKAVETFISLRYPATENTNVRTITTVGTSFLAVAELEAWIVDGVTIAFNTRLEPSGYVLLRAHTRCPPIKIYYDQGTFFELPPDFINTLREELLEELRCLKVKHKIVSHKNYEKRWTSLLNPEPDDETLTAFIGSGRAGPLLTTTWNQGSPYNWYAPVCSGGPGGRAWAGCVATAMAQVMRFHQFPQAISGECTSFDFLGNCTGTHLASDAGLDDYDWAHMPNQIDSNSSLAEKQAVGQLIYHAGVSVNMDFEADGSGALSFLVPNALRNFFSYSCEDHVYRSNYSDTEWYNKIIQDINNNQPVYYDFDSSGGGHAIVCDGALSGNQIHLNFGWSGSCNGWYNMNSVVCNGTWTDHGAVFNIQVDCTVPGDPVNLIANETGENTIELQWNTGTPSGPFYNIYRAIGSCDRATFEIIKTGHSATTYVDTHATGPATYAYKVTSTDSTGACESGFSNCDDAYAAGTIPILSSTGFILLLGLFSLFLVIYQKRCSSLRTLGKWGSAGSTGGKMKK